MMKFTLKALFGALAFAALAPAALAADVTLRFHQLLPPQATIPAKAIVPWIQKVEKESGGRIKIQHFPSMQLGGKPPELFDQAKDGVVDIVWTVLGYTPGRFPKSRGVRAAVFHRQGRTGVARLPGLRREERDGRVQGRAS